MRYVHGLVCEITELDRSAHHPYGFDIALYNAINLETIDNPLFNLTSSDDITALASRLAEWEALNGDSRIQNSA